MRLTSFSIIIASIFSANIALSQGNIKPNSSEVATIPAFYPSYPLFRDKFVDLMQKSKENISIITHFLSDGDIATSLFSAKLRGINTKVLLDKHGISSYLSRHLYLAENQVTITTGTLRGFSGEQQSLIVIDSISYYLNTPLDAKYRGTVNLKVASISSTELENWFKNSKAIAPPAPTANTDLKTANNPTTPPSYVQHSDTIKARQRVRAFTRRGLPKETRLRLLEQGIIDTKTGNTENIRSLAPEPNVSSRESDLP